MEPEIETPSPDLVAEMLLASQGGVVKPKPLTPEMMERAGQLPAQIRTAIVSFLSSDEPEPFVMQAQPDHDKTLEALSTDLDPAALDLITAPLEEDELHASYSAALMAARSYALEHWPTLTVEMGFGVETMEPDTATMMEASAILAVINNPRRILQNLKAWAVEGAEVEAVEACYPEIYDLMTTTLMEEINQRRLRKSWRLDWQKEAQANVLLQKPPKVTVTKVERQEAPAPSKSKPVSQTKAALTLEATPSQQIEAK